MKSRAISRRELLGTTAAAAGALLLHQFAAAQTTSPAPFVFALISDTHLGRFGEKPSAQMRQAVEEINASPAELTIHCGDLVNAGEVAANEKRYPEWMEIASKWKNPWHAIPGNHDPLALFTKHIHPQTDFVVDVDRIEGSGYRVSGVGSEKPSKPDTRHPIPGFRFICFRDALPNPEHMGAVENDQLQWIQSQIDAATNENRRVFLVSHIIYHDNAKPDAGWKIRDNREAFKDLLQRNSKTIAAFFAGHFHTGLRGWDDTFAIHEVVLPSVCWNFDGKKMRNAPGYAFEEDRPGWVLAELTSEKLTLRYKPLGAEISVVKELAIG